MAIAADFSHARRSDWSLPVAAYGLFAIVAGLALHPAALSMAKTWLSSSTYHHGVAVAPLALLMILSRPRIDPATGPSFLLGVIAAALVWLAGHAAGVALVEQFAFVSLLIAGAGVFFGAAAFRLWALPLLFLYFMVPFGEILIPFLQQATAGSVVTLLNLVGLSSTIIDGVLIKTPAGLFQIAEACAGLNFLLAALMIAYIYACQVLPSLRARLVFLFIATLIALAANFLRVFVVILIADLSGMALAVGPDHWVIGLVFYGAVFFVLFWIGAKMKKPRDVFPEHAPVMARRPWRGTLAVLAFVPVLLAAFYAKVVVDVTPPTGAAEVSVFNAPGWRILSGPQNWTPAIDADRMRVYTYERNGERVYVGLAGFTHDRRAREIVNTQNSAAGGDWRRIAGEEDVVYLFGESRAVPLEIFAGPQRRRLLTLTAYWRGDEVYTDPLAFKAAQMKDKLKGANPPGGVIVIASDYAGEPSKALNRIRAFTGDVERFSAWRARHSSFQNGGVR
ncbi:exosortase A [Hyphococcus luteus]|uniref:EpsI family protein n=1 Tax=Hyphococcus luteus TaxID=2058213 RepID=A0A2S7JZM5_9PROT|nr:exosortase A [Marinicaulis flavus]PQA85705.1 EpsI family protein [Marinicaulis flavus]